MTRHRHNGPSVSYRTRRGRIKHRKRPLHPITRKKEGRRGSRRFKHPSLGRVSEEELEYLRDTFDLEPEEIPEDEAVSALEERRELEDEDDNMPVGEQPSMFGNEYIRVKGNRTGPITIGEIERGDAISKEDI